MRDRRIVLLLIATIIFGLGIVLWYFFKATPAANPSITTPVNPFGTADTRPRGEFITASGVTNGVADTENERIPASERVLVQVWDKPVGGYAFATRDIIVEGTTTPAVGTSTPAKTSKPTKKTLAYLLFVDRITGYIYGYNPENSTPFQITNTSMPGIYDAYIIQNGTRVFMRYLDSNTGAVKTITASIPSFIEGADPHGLTNVRNLQDGVSSFAVSTSGNLYSYVVPSFNGSSIYNVNQKGAFSVTTSPLREWTVVYGGETPYIYNKPSAYLEGATYTLPNNTYVVGGKTGLMSLPNSQGDKILSSMWSSSGLTTFVSKRTGLSVLDAKTLASKCVWLDAVRAACGIPSAIASGNEGLPDDWFQGTVSFSDDLYALNTDTGESTGLLNLANTPGNPFDLIRMQVDKTLSNLVFINRQDNTLWMVNLRLLLGTSTPRNG